MTSRLSRQQLFLLMIVLALAIWLPRGLVLDRFVTADEHAWLTRSGNFFYALNQGNWAGTFQRHHPGVTTTWAGVAGFLTTYPEYAQDAPGHFGWLTEEIEPFLRAQGVDPVSVLAASRMYVVLIITVTLLVALWLATRLLGLWATLSGFALVAFDPFHLAHSRLLHLDGLVSSFMLLAVIAFVSHLFDRRFYTLLIAALATGLAWLTRSPAFFLAPLLALLTLLFWLYRRQRPALADEEIGESVWLLLGKLVLLATLASAVFVLLWPAMWVDPWGSFSQILSAASTYAAEGHLKPVFYDGEIYAGDPGFSFYPVTYLWRASPVALMGLLLAVLAFVRKQKPLDTDKARFTAIGLALYAILFLLFMNLGAKKFDRYLLPSYLPLDLIAGMGWAAAGFWLYERSHSILALRAVIVMAVLVATLQLTLALPTFPYYLSYYNPLLGGSSRAPEVMMIGWGEGADQAAHYLNGQPAAAQAVAASSYTNGPFSYFFAGKTLPITFWHEADYAIVYAQDWQRQLPSRKSIAHYQQQTPQHVVRIDGLDYAHIFDLRNAPLANYVTDWHEPGSSPAKEENAAIRLVTFQLPAAPISPGESFRAIFYFANLAPIATNLNVLVRVVGADGQEIARSEGWPWGSPTSAWQLDQVWPDGHQLSIPENTPPGYYRIEVVFYDSATQELWEARQAATGETIGDGLLLDYIQVGAPADRPDLPMKPPADLGTQARLMGSTWYDDTGTLRPDRTPVQPGQPLSVQLHWQAKELIDVDYTVFVHVIGPDGSVVVQSDRQPLNGFMPTTAWIPDQVVIDEHVFVLPESAPHGEYEIYTGMYDLATMERLPVSRAGEITGDSVELAKLRVEASLGND